jgi:RNA-splicing ligase RtcB
MKQNKIEISLERNDHDATQFLVYDAQSNRVKFRSLMYTRRANAMRGAKRYAKTNNFKISRWLL